MITTGGTGGHVFPGLAVAAKLVARGWRVFWLGTRDGMEARLVPQHGVPSRACRSAACAARACGNCCSVPSRLRGACWQSRGIIRRRAPDVVLGFGGFASFPGALMGVAAAKPLVLHEANAVAGLANRDSRVRRGPDPAGLPRRIRRAPRSARSTGSAIRCATRSRESRRRRHASRDARDRCALLVVGGSLGAAGLNERVPTALALLPRERGRTSCTRRANATSTRCVPPIAAAGVDAECVAFIDDMAARYASADLVDLPRRCDRRVAELAAVGVGSIIVPLPGAIADEQSANAQFLVDAGAAMRIAQTDAHAASAWPRACGAYDARNAARDGAALRAGSRVRTPRARVADACIALGDRAR